MIINSDQTNHIEQTALRSSKPIPRIAAMGELSTRGILLVVFIIMLASYPNISW